MEKKKSPRDRFREEMGQIQRKTNEVNGIEEAEEYEDEEDFSDDELEALEDELEKVDKNMGNESYPVTMTKGDYDQQRCIEEHNKAIAQFKKSNSDHLSTEDKKDLMSILESYRSKKLDNPVLKHLIEQKGELSRSYIENSKKIQNMYKDLLQEMSNLTNDIMKTKGAIENVDKQILQIFRRGIDGEEKLEDKSQVSEV